MCFTATNLIPKIAEKDIICYKGTTEGRGFFWFESEFQYHRYRRGKKQKKISLTLEDYSMNEWSEERQNYVEENHLQIESGYHSFIDLFKARKIFGFYNYGRFKIPAGSIYYQNDNENQYVSDQIIYLGRA